MQEWHSIVFRKEKDLMVSWIDTHAHIYAAEFDDDRSEMMQRALDAGVRHILMPNIDEDSLQPMKLLHASYPEQTSMMIGLHPCSVQKGYESFLEKVEQEAATGKYLAIGEIGMDLYWDKSTRDLQEEAFKIQCEIAVKYNLPIAVHSRESTPELIHLLQQMENRPEGVFHCFTGSREEADTLIGMGFYLGIGGVYTFKNTHLREVIQKNDLNKIILETDAPYLAPVPYRGKRNEPSYIPLIGRHLADHLGVEINELARITEANSKALFGLS